MKRKWLFTCGIVVLVLLVAAAAIRMLYAGPVQSGSTEQSAYQIRYRQLGKKLLVMLEKDADPTYDWCLSEAEPESAIRELRGRRDRSRFLVDAGDSMYVTAEFLLQNQTESEPRYVLNLEIVKDGDGRLMLLTPRETNLSGSISGGTDTLPYSCISQEDGSLHVYIDMDADTEWSWAYEAEDGLSVAGPENTPRGFLFYVKPLKTGEYCAEIGIVSGLALKMEISVTTSEQAQGLMANMSRSKVEECTLENLFLLEEQAQFEQHFGVIGGLEEATVSYYQLKRWYVTAEKDEEGVEGGEIGFQIRQMPANNWILYLSDVASLHGFQVEFGLWYSQSETIQCSGKEVTLYQDEGYMAAVWKSQNRVFALECSGMESSMEQSFLDELSVIIEAN